VNKLTKAQPKIDWDGPSAAELIDFVSNNSPNSPEDNHGNTNNTIASNGTTNNSPSGEESITLSSTSEPVTTTVQGKSSVYLRLIRQYLYDLLKDKDCAFFKISHMTQELGINQKTVFKHLKILRQSEFEIKREQFGTIVKKRQF
jgi:biotin operon repressor